MLARDFRREAWSKLSGRWGQMIGITVVYGLILGLASAIPTVGSIINLLIAGPISIGYMAIALKIIRAEEAKLEGLFDYFHHYGNTTILYITNGIFIALWSLLFVIPGIVKTYAYSMSYYIMADNPDMKASEASEASMRMMQGNKWRLFCLHFSFIGWMFLSIFTFGILLLWVVPYMQEADAAFYQSLVGVNQPEVIDAEPVVE